MKDLSLFKKIYKEHFKKFKNISVPNKKLLICFSGIPGSGKTYISKILEKKYSGIRIRNDGIRQIIHNLLKKEDEENPENLDYVDPILEKYLFWLFLNYSLENKLIILDSGIDRRYKEIFSMFKNKKYTIFLIRIKTSRKILEQRIFEKKNCRDPHFDREIKRWTLEWKEFGKKIKADIVIENENKLNLKPLFIKLDKLTKKE